jgi:hypothetical protein
MRKNGILAGLGAAGALAGIVMGTSDPPVLEWADNHSPPAAPTLSWPTAIKYTPHETPGESAVFVAGTVNESGLARFGLVRYSTDPNNVEARHAIWPLNDDGVHRPLRAMAVYNDTGGSTLRTRVYVAGEVPTGPRIRTLVAAFDQDLGRPLWTRLFERPPDEEVGDDIPIAVVSVPFLGTPLGGVAVLVACYNPDRTRVSIGVAAYNYVDSTDLMAPRVHGLTPNTRPVGMLHAGGGLLVLSEAIDPATGLGSFYTVGFGIGWEPDPFLEDWNPTISSNLDHMRIAVPGRHLEPISISMVVAGSPSTFVVTGTSYPTGGAGGSSEVFTASYNDFYDHQYAPPGREMLRWTDSWTPITGASMAQHITASAVVEDVPGNGGEPQWGRAW